VRTNDTPCVMLVCVRCGVGIERCAFCERDACPEPICAKSLRVELRESMAERHEQGG